jgi:hypothetical protein
MELKYFNGLGGFTMRTGRNSSFIWGPTDRRRFLDQHYGELEVRRIDFESVLNLFGAATAKTIVSRRGSTIRLAIRPEPPSTSAMMRSGRGCPRPNRFGEDAYRAGMVGLHMNQQPRDRTMPAHFRVDR